MNATSESQRTCDRVKQVVSDQTSNTTAHQIAPDHELKQHLGLDSLDRVEIVIALEDEFGIVFQDADFERLAEPAITVQALIEQVERLLSTTTRAGAIPG
jgi:acyl carrier protein